MTTIVVNRSSTDDYDVYIGRPSKWGNPFRVGEDGTREEVIEKYRKWFLTSEEASVLRNSISEIFDKKIACWCKPKSCHGDVLAEYANSISNSEDLIYDD